MGRGRAKAKQTKVARDLKYRSYSTDFGSLERELRGESETDLVEDEDVEEDEEEEAEEWWRRRRLFLLLLLPLLLLPLLRLRPLLPSPLL